MSCGKNHAKTHKWASRIRTGTRPFVQGEKSWRRRFLGEMRRSNNPLQACEVAKIRWVTYLEWRRTGFLSDDMLEEAETAFHARHPGIDMLASLSSAQEIEEQGIGAQAAEAVQANQGAPLDERQTTLKQLLEMRGYDSASVLKDLEGWTTIGDYELE